MASNASQEAYEGMIAALTKFQNGIQESCTSMKSAVDDCIENMNQDAHAVERTGEISQAISRLQAIAEEAADLAQKIQREWETIVSA